MISEFECMQGSNSCSVAFLRAPPLVSTSIVDSSFRCRKEDILLISKNSPQMSRKGCDFPLPVEWHSACNFKVQLSFAVEIFRALAPARERDIKTYEKLYSRRLLD